MTEGVAATAEEDREDTRITFHLSLLKKHKTYLWPRRTTGADVSSRPLLTLIIWEGQAA